MPELKFTHHFKHKFAQGLENYFIESTINLGVKTEYRTKVGEEENRIDVAIIHPSNDNLFSYTGNYDDMDMTLIV